MTDRTYTAKELHQRMQARITEPKGETMRFTLTIDCDSASFHNDDRGQFAPEEETARILAIAAERVRSGFYDGKLRDANGNTVGRFGFEESD